MQFTDEWFRRVPSVVLNYGLFARTTTLFFCDTGGCGCVGRGREGCSCNPSWSSVRLWGFTWSSTFSFNFFRHICTLQQCFYEHRSHDCELETNQNIKKIAQTSLFIPSPNGCKHTLTLWVITTTNHACEHTHLLADHGVKTRLLPVPRRKTKPPRDENG